MDRKTGLLLGGAAAAAAAALYLFNKGKDKKGGALTITTAALAPGAVGKAYKAALAASGGKPPYAWAASGVPEGLSVGKDGAITGTPTKTGSFTLHASVTDAAGGVAKASFPIVVGLAGPAGAPVVSQPLQALVANLGGGVAAQPGGPVLTGSLQAVVLNLGGGVVPQLGPVLSGSLQGVVLNMGGGVVPQPGPVLSGSLQGVVLNLGRVI